ncbi:MAG: arylamine N-acetyltransferase family protein [Croceibacterium sp.]
MNDRQLAAYLERLAHGANLRPDFATLRSLHRAHLEAIPFEALDVQLGAVPSMEPDVILEKLVGQRRGGWCYEMNGLFGRALEHIGFDVTRVSCGVMRHVGGEERMGTHLALLVRLDGRDWLADVGFGSSLIEPIPLAEARHDHRPFEVGLSQTDDGHWRFSEYASVEPFSFDFRAAPADEALLAEKCRWQASAAESNFVLNFVAQKRAGDRHIALRGKVLSERSPQGESRRELKDADDLAAVLTDTFGIEHPDVRTIWPRIEARHMELFAA